MATRKKIEAGYDNHGAEMKRADDAVAAAVQEDRGHPGGAATTATFDLSDLDDLAEEAAADDAESRMAALEAWTEKAIEPRQSKPGAVIFDIETGPRPLAEIECFCTPPEPLPPWDESMVKYGNAKREELRAEKRLECMAKYQEALNAESVARDAHKAEWLDKAALSPVTGRVLLIGAMDHDKKIFYDQDDEESNLLAFWDFVENTLANKQPLIGHNSNSFDLPFLVRRSWALGVHVPREVRQGRYWNPLFLDTMEHWNCGAREYVSLNTLGAFFGVGQKTEGVEGKDFAKLWFGLMPPEQWGAPEKQRAKAIEYNTQDLKLTAAVAEKMGMM